eukprot:CAMPEP_0184686372 /NCGR_PEP_ID=MMETSP0312-20130426/22155_1 /TAXON_ID=31354 /ORGANISM="Compsopogon coeruleus, Strain SAG 36.94" /LENGTH=59 /DNA_ID=CAMNT_0027141371 /DNA_START=19 /DNA_END=194 /DNA_ORIENTATION=-
MSSGKNTVSFGYSISSQDRSVWCTQTFGTFLGQQMSGGSCSIVRATISPTPRPSSRPTV